MKTDLKDICYELNSVWDAIGGDVLTAMEEMGEEPVLSKADVADLILDHMRNFDFVSPDTIKYLDGISSLEDTLKAVEACLDFERYGW